MDTTSLHFILYDKPAKKLLIFIALNYNAEKIYKGEKFGTNIIQESEHISGLSRPFMGA